MENKILCLENNLAVEKLAREHLEKEVEERRTVNAPASSIPFSPG